MCERLLANPLIEDYEVDRAGARHEVRRRPLPRLLRRGRRAAGLPPLRATPSCSGTATATCSGVDAVVVPGGFSYGDYLRAGAIARFSPVMEAVIEFARDGGPVLGICNGFQVLCEAGLLPGALLPNDSLRFVCRQVDVDGRERRTRRSRARASEGDALSIPVKHTTGRYYAPPTARCSERARWCCATRRATTRTARMDDIAGVSQRGRQRDRPDAAPRARGRPAHRARPTAAGCSSRCAHWSLVA